MSLTPPKIDFSHLPAAPGVYQVINTVTGECYVGGSANIRTRGISHANLLANGDHYAKPMQESYDAHGHAAFRIEVLDVCDIYDLSARETAWIQKLSPVFNQQRKCGTIRSPYTEAEKKRGGKAKSGRRRLYQMREKRKAKAERRQKIVDGLIAGRKPVDLAAEFGVTKGTVYTFAHQAQVKIREAWHQAHRQRIIERCRAGESDAEIAGDLDIPASAVGRIRREAGIVFQRGSTPQHPSTTFVPREVWELVDWSKRDCEIAEELLVSRERVRQVRKILGKPTRREMSRLAVAS